MSASGAGTVKWQQVSEDLVPVNITCIQDSPECVFHITAYNSQVDKILDVRLVQPGKLVNIADTLLTAFECHILLWYFSNECPDFFFSFSPLLLQVRGSVKRQTVLFIGRIL